MIRRVLVFLAIAASIFIAQANGECVRVSTFDSYTGGFIPAYLSCKWAGGDIGWGTHICYQRSASCPVPSAAAETGIGCPWCEAMAKALAQAGKPINLSSGNVDISETDLQLPGIGGGLSITRTWNSMWPTTQLALQTGMFGRNWRSTYEERVFTADGLVKYSRSDGSFWSFGFGSTSGVLELAAPASEKATLVESDEACGYAGCWWTTWTMTFKNGERRRFSMATGLLISIADRNGNTTTLSYDSSDRLIQVTDPASRNLTFNYPDSFSHLVSSVTSPAGTTNYSYTDTRLNKVTRPDASFVTYEYDSAYLITAVKDSEGKILESHTYDDLCRGLSSSRAGGVEALTVEYPFFGIDRSAGTSFLGSAEMSAIGSLTRSPACPVDLGPPQ